MLVAGAYVVALAVAVAVALGSGDIGFLWRLTLFYEVDENLAGNWPNVFVLVLAGGLWAWGLWQSLRGPVAGEPPVMDRGVRRLRVALYAAVASYLIYLLVPVWPWWAVVLDSLLMLAVVVLFHPVLRRNVGPARLALDAGVLCYVATAAAAVFDVLDWRAAELVAELGGLDGLMGLFWMVLALVAQGRDGRWERATVRYGVASLVAPIALMLVNALFRFAGDVQGAYYGASDALMMIWLARSAHELATPYSRPVPFRPVLVRPPAFAVAVPLAACVVPILPPLVNLANGHPLWISPHVPNDWLTLLLGDVPATLWSGFELFAGVGGLAVVVLVAIHRGTRLTLRVAMGALLLAAVAGFTVVTLASDHGLPLEPGLRYAESGYIRGPAISPLWFTAACVVSAALLWWTHTMRATWRGDPT
ncbi:hypothetical protein ACFLIM_32500 [Nonomuraea sp. M3C6]|uniref:Uncharacterized protein n=1 Tax=Nonomuraea marmarensis TaxID=3351344 RepID=A0ABW7ALF2_9ACTN